MHNHKDFDWVTCVTCATLIKKMVTFTSAANLKHNSTINKKLERVERSGIDSIGSVVSQCLPVHSDQVAS